MLCVLRASEGILCVVWPESYRSSTLILVESQKIPEDYVKALIGPSVEERLSSLQQQVMSRTLLNQVIREFDLYPDAVRRFGNEVVIERLRKDIRVVTNLTRAQRGVSMHLRFHLRIKIRRLP